MFGNLTKGLHKSTKWLKCCFLKHTSNQLVLEKKKPCLATHSEPFSLWPEINSFCGPSLIAHTWNQASNVSDATRINWLCSSYRIKLICTSTHTIPIPSIYSPDYWQCATAKLRYLITRPTVQKYGCLRGWEPITNSWPCICMVTTLEILCWEPNGFLAEVKIFRDPL